MRTTTVLSAVLDGIEARPVRITATVSDGLPSFTINGMDAQSERECTIRVRAAIGNSGQDYPPGRVSVHIEAGGARVAGAGLDLPIALAVLGVEGVAFGELGLNGDVRGVRGALQLTERLAEQTDGAVIVPRLNAQEAALASTSVAGVSTLLDALNDPPAGEVPMTVRADPRFALDFADIRGMHAARTSLEVAAITGQNVLIIGPPGAGKTMLARRLPGILPLLTEDESLDVLRIYSAAGLGDGSLPSVRPFRAPHHTTSGAGLVGGGSGTPRPGEASLAHNGVLFLDEFPEFYSTALHSLKLALKAGEVVLSRAWGSVRIPARCQVVATMNPCPCGFLGAEGRKCRCSSDAVARYRARVDEFLPMFPILIDLTGEKIDFNLPPGEASAYVRERVMHARAKAAEGGARDP